MSWLLSFRSGFGFLSFLFVDKFGRHARAFKKNPRFLNLVFPGLFTRVRAMAAPNDAAYHDLDAGTFAFMSEVRVSFTPSAQNAGTTAPL
jgi:hypothetical protein